MLPDLPRQPLLDLFRRMVLFRRFEEALVLLTKAGHSFGHFHLYIGQETIGVPAISLLNPGDYIASTHRNHGHLLARGGRTRSGGGPTFVETQAFRWPGRRPLWPDLVTGESDLAMAWAPGRIPSEHANWHAAHDGLLRFTRELLAAGLAGPDQLLAIDREVRDELTRAARFARESPYPVPQEALEDVFAS